MSKFWTKTLFWQRVRDSLAIFGTPGGAIAAYIETNPAWLCLSAVSAVLVALIAIWMADHDKNGIVDIFEDNEKEH